ncbi:c-type cytochrome [Pseudomaricurvus sp.]|uniref:c-type cytochrome n=1 Tax=Pseudomaricurvus sp. TaxID=2004510 RepID=UPI003F6B1A47
MAVNRTYKFLIVGILVLLASVTSIKLLSSPELAELADLETYTASVEQGEYLAKAGNCATCHTTEGGEPYAGGLEFVTPFGVLYSTNITPDKETGIGNWSFKDFYNSMKHGVRPDGSHLYPAFPYTDFAKMTDDDIASLFKYFQTVEPVHQPAKENQLGFPFNQRELMSGWKMLFHSTDTFQPDETQSDAWNRGAYLVEGPGHCGACHTPRNVFGAEQESLALTGGTYMDKVKFGYHRPWSGVNLTSDTTGLASWTETDITEYLKTGISGNAIVHGPMREVVMNSTRHLSDQDVQAMATYLKSLPAKAQDPAPAPDPKVVEEGEFVYTVHCGSCHLPSGKGDEGLGVTLAGSPTVQAPDPSSLINVILYGPHLPARLSIDRSNMKMFGKRLSDVDIANVATYVRSSFGNTAGEVTPEQVNVQR